MGDFGPEPGGKRCPVALADDTEPQPDFTVLRRRAVAYKDREAWAEDAVLVIEVAESSLADDRSTKPRLYARRASRSTGSWTAPRRRSRCTADPTRDGYRDVRLVTGAAMPALMAFPEMELGTTEIFA